LNKIISNKNLKLLKMTIQGFILIDEDGVALNNSGTVQVAGTENRVATKKISKHGQSMTYVSGQAWRYWWRETLQSILIGKCLQS
jgi:CRISPR-associated protein Cst2